MMSLRRSGRKRTQSNKAAQHFPDVLAEILSDSDSSIVHGDDDDEAEDNFAPLHQAEESDQDEDFSAEDDASNDDNGNFTDEEDDNDDISDVISVDDHGRTARHRKPKPRQRRKNKRIRPSSDIDHRTKGVMDYNTVWIKNHYIPFTLGDDDVTYAAFLRMCKRFDNNATLPKRHGMLYTFFQNEQSRQKEIMSGWEWYDRSGRSAFQNWQRLEDVDQDEGRSYMDVPNGKGSYVVLDSIGDPQVDTVAPFTALSLVKDQTEPFGSRQPAKWIINVGECVQSMAWAPNQHSSTQYLAISTINTKGTIPAFSSSPQTPSAIQIWSFKSLSVGARASTIDASTTPKLERVYCCNFGRIRLLRWCPVQRPSMNLDEEYSNYVGMLAVVSSDGSIRVLDVSVESTDQNSTSFSKVTSVAFESRPPETIFTSVAWNNSSTLTAACANGYIAVFNLASHFSSSETPVAQPSLYQPVHISYIHAVISCYPSSPNHIITSSADGNMILTDLLAPDSDTVAPGRNRLNNSTLIWHSHLAHALYADEITSLRSFNPRQFFNGVKVFQSEGSLGVADASPVHASIVVGMLDGTVWIVNPTRRVVGKGERGNDNGARGGWKMLWLKHDWRRGRPSKNSAPESGTDQETQAQVDHTETAADATDVEMSGTDQVSMNHLPLTTTNPRVDGEPTGDSATQRHTVSANGEPTQAPLFDEEDHHNLDFPQGLSRLHTPHLDARRMNLSKRLEGNAPSASKIKRKQTNTRFRFDEKTSITIYEEQTGARAAAWNPNIEVGGWCAVGFGDGLVVVGDLCEDDESDSSGSTKLPEEEGNGVQEQNGIRSSEEIDATPRNGIDKDDTMEQNLG